MKLKQKLMAAAIALVAASGANAATSTMASGNSSLAFVAMDYTGSPISTVMDLGFNVDSFLKSAVASDAGYKVVWNFNTNSMTVNGVAQSGDYAWSNALTTFYGTAQNAEVKWGVIGGDSVTNGTPGDLRYFSTSSSTLATVQNQSKANMAGFSLSDNVFSQNNLLPSHTTNAEGGSTATSGLAYVGNGGTFGTAGKWQNKSTFVAVANEGVDMAFYMLDTNNGTSSTKALVTEYKNSLDTASFSYANGVLTYEIAAAIPEPSEYALMLAGLGMLGFMARRRLANRA